jgi:signal transduction histidine kinase
MNNKSVLGNLAGWIFGLAVAAVGVVNMFWGNDPFFGVFLFLLSFVFIPPVNAFIRKSFGFSIPLVAKIILLVFIIWAAVGVGELFQKIDLMMSDLS